MRTHLATGLLACAASSAALAQSSVTVYGTVDLGLTWVSNGGGGPLWLEDSGVLRAGRLGFAGTEDLGGGTTAIFTLEQGAFHDTGTLGQGGAGFGRQSFVGLSNPSLGTLTLGRQYDMMNRLVRYASAGDVGAVYDFHHGDYDRLSGYRVNNSVKWVSPVVAGLQGALMFGMGEGTGAQTFSGGISYVNGPLDMGLSFSDTHKQPINPSLDLGVATFLGRTAGAIVADRYRPLGFGMSYDFGGFKPHVSFTNVKIEYQGLSASLQSVDIGASWYFGPAAVGAGVTRSKLEGAQWMQYSVGYIYNLSRRTKLYANLNYQKASGNARNAVMPTLIASSNRSQTVPHFGISHNF